MSQTFNLSINEVESKVPLPHKGLQLGLSPESESSSISGSPSPDSSSFSYLSNREDDGSPDTNMLECCLSDGSPVDYSPHNVSSPQGDASKKQTFVFTPVNCSMDFWNENLSLLTNQQRELVANEGFCVNSEDGSNSAVISPDSVGTELSSCEISRTGSTENSCYSPSSGEMIMRSKSFRLEDESLLVFSSLEESSVSPAVGLPALPAESNVLSTTLPDVCENSTEVIAEENTAQSHLGMTFIKGDNWEPFVDESDMVTSNSLLHLPQEREGGLLMTFVCEPSEDSGRDAELAGAETEQLSNFRGAFTPEQGMALVSTQSTMQETQKDIHTSTPVQTIGNKIPSFPSFSESPCTGNTSSTGMSLVKQQSISVTPKERLVAGLPPSGSKLKNVETKRFLKSDYSSIKSKVVTKSRHQMTVPGSLHKLSEMSMNKRGTEANKGATIGISPTKARSRLTVGSTAKTVSGSQRQVKTGASNLGKTVIQSCGHVDGDGMDGRPSPPDHRSSTRSEPEQATPVADTSAQDAGNNTFCFPSLEKSPDRNCKTDPKQSPKKSISAKTEVRSGSALGQEKAALLKTRPRCLSDTLSSLASSRPPKVNRTTVRILTSFTIPQTPSPLGQTKPGNPICSSQNKRATQAETTNRAADISTRAVRKISLLVSLDLNQNTTF